MNYLKNVLILILPLTLCGCIAVWGKSYNVALSNSRSVVIEYDPAVVNLPAMLNDAQQACSKYGKDAVLAKVSTSNLGIIVNNYRCEQRVADKVIDVQK